MVPFLLGYLARCVGGRWRFGRPAREHRPSRSWPSWSWCCCSVVPSSGELLELVPRRVRRRRDRLDRGPGPGVPGRVGRRARSDARPVQPGGVGRAGGGAAPRGVGSPDRGERDLVRQHAAGARGRVTRPRRTSTPRCAASAPSPSSGRDPPRTSTGSCCSPSRGAPRGSSGADADPRPLRRRRSGSPATTRWPGRRRTAFLRMDTLVDNPYAGTPDPDPGLHRARLPERLGAHGRVPHLAAVPVRRRRASGGNELRYNLATSTAVLPSGHRAPGTTTSSPPSSPRDDLDRDDAPVAGPGAQRRRGAHGRTR